MISREGHSVVFKPCHDVIVLALLSLWDQYKRSCKLRLLVLYSDLRGFPVFVGPLLCSESFFLRYSGFLRSPRAPFAYNSSNLGESTLFVAGLYGY